MWNLAVLSRALSSREGSIFGLKNGRKRRGTNTSLRGGLCNGFLLPQRARRAQSFLGEYAPSAGGENNVGLQIAIIFGLKTIVKKKRGDPIPGSDGRCGTTQERKSAA